MLPKSRATVWEHTTAKLLLASLSTLRIPCEYLLRGWAAFVIGVGEAIAMFQLSVKSFSWNLWEPNSEMCFVTLGHRMSKQPRDAMAE